MKMLVMDLVGVGVDRLLGDERLGNLRQLAAAGCFGRLEPAAAIDDFQEGAIRAQVTEAGGQTMLLHEDDGIAQHNVPPEGSGGQWHAARQAFEAGGWEYLRFGMGQLEGEAADRRIGQVLELLDGETVVLALLGMEPGARDGFILAAPGYPPLGELRGVTVADLAPTLLEMAGYEAPEGIGGRSLVAGLAPAAGGQGLSDDEEALLRARLEGLGYIG
jgi:hypothetical protein